MENSYWTAGRFFPRKVMAFLIATILLGAAALPASARGLNPSEKMMWSTYAFGTKHGLATCFVVVPRHQSGPGTAVIVVTAGHVLATAPHGPYYLAARIGEVGSDPVVMLFELRPPQSKAPIFVKHPQYDIGAFEIVIPPELADVVRFPSFLNENSIGSDRDRPRAGEDVLFAGFPMIMPGTAGGFPVLRAGKIASYSGGGTQRPFLINADVYPGDSGGPVYLARRHGAPRLIGMVTARGGRNPKEVLPLAIAIDATTIREVVQQAKARQSHPVHRPSSTTDRATKNVARSGGPVSEANSWKVLAPGDASRELAKKSHPLKVETRER